MSKWRPQLTDDDNDKELKVKALESTIEWSKQLITLATGTLVISGTFIKDLFSNSIKWESAILVCWTSMCLSVLFGVLYIGAAADLFVSKNKKLDILSNPGRTIALVQIVTFFVGLVCFVAFAALNL